MATKKKNSKKKRERQFHIEGNEVVGDFIGPAVESSAGRIARVYPWPDYTVLILNITDGRTPGPDGKGFFLISTSHPNYNAIISAALLAAGNGYSVRIAVTAAITPTQPAVIQRLWVDVG